MIVDRLTDHVRTKEGHIISDREGKMRGKR